MRADSGHTFGTVVSLTHFVPPHFWLGEKLLFLRKPGKLACSTSMTRLSTIIPVFNRQVSAERAMRSALKQHVDGAEVVVVDDGSQPPFEIPPDLRSGNVHLFRHAVNKGAAAARNTGVQAARGDWIAFLDSDDYWMPSTLSQRLETAERDFTAEPSILVAYAAGYVLYDESKGRRETRVPRASDKPLDFASGCWFSPGSTLLLRKQIFQQIGPFDTTLRRLEDFDWFLRFANAGGRLSIWPNTAAMIEIGPRPDLAIVEDTTRRLDAKYARGRHRLSASQTRRLRAYLDLERASAHVARARWISAVYYMLRSLIRVPRRSLHLKQFWDIN